MIWESEKSFEGLARPGQDLLLALPVLECIDFVGELSGVDEAAQDVVVELRNPSAMPLRCSKRPLIASTGSV